MRDVCNACWEVPGGVGWEPGAVSVHVRPARLVGHWAVGMLGVCGLGGRYMFFCRCTLGEQGLRVMALWAVGLLRAP